MRTFYPINHFIIERNTSISTAKTNAKQAQTKRAQDMHPTANCASDRSCVVLTNFYVRVPFCLDKR